MSKEVKKLKDKSLGLFLVVDKGDEPKYVFYRAYRDKESIIYGIEHDQELIDLINELKPLELAILYVEPTKVEDIDKDIEVE